MRFKTILLSVAFAGAMGLAAVPASAQTCTETQFNAKTGDAYLKAETELITNKNAAAAIALAEPLKRQELNCYERGAVSRLLAAAYLQAGRSMDAVAELEFAIANGVITGPDVVTTYYNIGQLYLQADNLPKGAENLERWIRAGGRPDQKQNFQMAAIYNKMNRNTDAIKYAEAALAQAGSQPERQLFDFLNYLYDQTGQRAKQGALLERMLVAFPQDKQLWENTAGLYFAGNDERRAFEVIKAMYFAGFLKTEDELMRLVNFYNRFDVPYQAAVILEKEMNAGRITKSAAHLDLLANLYQVAREHEKAIPVIRQLAQASNSGQAYERLGRSLFEIGKFKDAEAALQQAIQRGNLKAPAAAWAAIGKARLELNDRAGAREAFQRGAATSGDNNGQRESRGWLDYMASEEATARRLRTFEIEVKVEEAQNRLDICQSASFLDREGEGDKCAPIEAELAEWTARLAAAN
jgi:tetratricopeptide (TPR) repeat protein